MHYLIEGCSGNVEGYIGVRLVVVARGLILCVRMVLGLEVVGKKQTNT